MRLGAIQRSAIRRFSMSPNPQQIVATHPSWKISNIPITRSILILIGFLIFSLTTYSIYVAVHEPDPQETLVFGQVKIASASPVSLRILVRNRISAKPIKAARVELSLVSKSGGTTKIATAETDASGSFADSVNIPEVPPAEYQLVIDTSSSLGRDHVVKKVEIHHPAQIL